MSAIHGDRYLRSGIAADRERQIAYFIRSLAQITSALQCPEAYFLEHGEYVPNDNSPLLCVACSRSSRSSALVL